MAKRQRGKAETSPESKKAREYPKKQFSKPSPAKPIDEAERVTPETAKPLGPLGLLTKTQMLEIFGVSHVTLRGLIIRGVIPPPRVFGGDGGCASTIRWIASEVYAAAANAPRRLPSSQQEGEDSSPRHDITQGDER